MERRSGGRSKKLHPGIIKKERKKNPTGSKPGDRDGRREELKEIETEVCLNTRDRDKTGTSTRREGHRKNISQED